VDGNATPCELERLYRERFQVFVRAITAQLGDSDVARDVVQDAFAAALARVDGYRGDAALEAWIWRILVNKALDRQREARRTASAPTQPSNVPYETNGRVEERRVVRARLAALPTRQRLAVFLHYYADLDYATIASVLEIAPGTVAATLNAARASLRERLRENTR